MLAAGTLVKGRYTIVHVLGGGGMGTVYLVTDALHSGQYCAMKEMVPDPNASPVDQQQAQQQFLREASILAGLSHRNLPRVFDYFTAGGNYYLVMDYVEGETLETVLNRTPGFLPESQVIAWGAQLCDVLAYLHTRQPPVIFRDLKPANIMVDRNGTVKLIDFGIARFFDPRKQTDTLKMGTIGYAPPEQYKGKGQTDTRSDVYSLGATLHHLSTRRDPTQYPPFSFHTTPPRSLNPNVSPHVEAAIMKALAYDGASRFQSVLEMKQALLGQVPPSPPPARTTVVVTPPTHQRRLVQRPMPFLLIAVLVLVLGIVLATMRGLAISPRATPTAVLPSPTPVLFTPTPAPSTPTPKVSTPTPVLATPTPVPPTATALPPTSTPPAPVNLSTMAQVSASGQAKDGIDTCGNTVSYRPSNLTDGQRETAWRVDGDGRGAWVRFDFPHEVTLSSIQILPGYSKRDPCDKSIDWCPKNRIPQRVRLQTSAGERIELTLENECTWQGFDIGLWHATWLRVTILSSYPRREEHRADYTAISEIQLLGWEF